ncbi:MAG TPA: hypothetical protein VFN11_07220 [Ktedonobacterales bacterium]|nr:hypothetical protein [Ktedonobacterales bacterium]
MASQQQPEKRVQFDFDVTFTNGGGLRGDSFRLDIPGEDIDDNALANHGVRDLRLRLLMVQSIHITNKRIIDEPHKRGIEAASGTANFRCHIDLSHSIEDGITQYL